MNSERLSKWFEKRYLEYQMEHGLMSLKDFSKIIGISRPYLSLILSGERQDISEEAARKVCEGLNDWSLMDLLGYDRPAESMLPPGLKANFDAAIEEISSKYSELDITDFSSPEAVKIAKDILESHGIMYKRKSGLPANENS